MGTYIKDALERGGSGEDKKVGGFKMTMKNGHGGRKTRHNTGNLGSNVTLE